MFKKQIQCKLQKPTTVKPMGIPYTYIVMPDYSNSQTNNNTDRLNLLVK